MISSVVFTESFETPTIRPHQWLTFNEDGYIVDWVMIIVLSAMFICGLLANILILMSFQSKQPSNSMLLFSHLCVTDLLTIVTQVPTAIYILSKHRYIQSLYLSNAICLATGFMFDLLTMTTLLLTAVCSIDRVVALTKPLEYRQIFSYKTTVVSAIVCWVVSVLFVTSFVVAYIVEEGKWSVYKNNSALALCDAQYLWTDSLSTTNTVLPKIIKIIILSITGSMISLITLCNVLVILVLRIRLRRNRTINKSKNKSRRKANSAGAADVDCSVDTLDEPRHTVSAVNAVNIMLKGKLKEEIASESVVILGTYFTLSFGTFIVLQYFMPSGFYAVRSLFKYNSLLLIQVLLLLNSTINPMVHYMRNHRVRNRINNLVRSVKPTWSLTKTSTKSSRRPRKN